MTTNRPLTVFAVMLSLFMSAMEATVVATAMPTAVADLGGIELYGWAGSVYLLGSTVSMPIYGKLADVFGRKRLMLSGIVIFLAGSMASGLAHTMLQLIAFRALQAIGAGALQALAFTIIGDIYTAEQRARMQGLFGAVWAVAGISGPFLGGLIVRALSWRWVFYVNVPVGAIAAALYAVAFHERVERRPVSLDVAGALALTAAIVALLLGASSVAPALTLPLGAVLTVLFVWREKRARDPVLPLDLLRMRVIAVTSALAVLLGGAMTSAVIYLPLFLQSMEHATPSLAGATLSPMRVGWPIASAARGRLLARTGSRPLIVLGWISAFVGAGAVAIGVTSRQSPTFIGAGMFVFGVGLGLANTPMLIAVQDAVEWRQRGVATASTTFFRSIGGALAVGALGAVLVAPLQGSTDPHVLSALFGPEHGRTLPPDVLQQLSGGLGTGLDRVFVIIAVMAFATVLTSLTFPALRLKKVSDPGAASSAA